MPHGKWREVDLQLPSWLQLTLLGWCLVSLPFPGGVSFEHPVVHALLLHCDLQLFLTSLYILYSIESRFVVTAEGVKYTHSVSCSRVSGEGGKDKKGVKVIPPFIQK